MRFLQVAINGKNLHAPLVERLIDLPMDITGGRINGELTLRAHNPQTWHFPSFGGRIRYLYKAHPPCSKPWIAIQRGTE